MRIIVSLIIFYLFSLSCLLSCKTKAKQRESIDDEHCLSPYITKKDSVNFKTFEFTNEKVKDFVTKAIQSPDFQKHLNKDRYLILSMKHEAPNTEHISLTYDMVFVRKYEDWFYAKLCGIPIFIHKNDLPISFIKTSAKTKSISIFADDVLICAWPTYSFVVLDGKPFQKEKWHNVMY